MVKLITRAEYHAKKWKKMYGQDDCPFCNLEERRKEWSVRWEWKYWYILHNTGSYSWDDFHLMAVPYEHIKFAHKLRSEHIAELQEVYRYMKNYFWEKNYFSFTRESIGNRSVEHLHIQFCVWILQGKYLRNMLMNQGYPIKEYLD